MSVHLTLQSNSVLLAGSVRYLLTAVSVSVLHVPGTDLRYCLVTSHCAFMVLVHQVLKTSDRHMETRKCRQQVTSRGGGPNTGTCPMALDDRGLATRLSANPRRSTGSKQMAHSGMASFGCRPPLHSATYLARIEQAVTFSPASGTADQRHVRGLVSCQISVRPSLLTCSLRRFVMPAPGLQEMR